MTILFLLIPLAVVLMGTAVVVFLWALREGQFDDLDSPGLQVVLDDERAPPGAARHDGSDVGTDPARAGAAGGGAGTAMGQSPDGSGTPAADAADNDSWVSR